LLHHLSEVLKRQFYLQNQGREANVLFESDNSMGFMHGFSENYIKVKTTFSSRFVNQVVHVKLDNLAIDGTFIV
jgi:threonylcarbamoyladenosine tRNA methylthiotransferase MtaB